MRISNNKLNRWPCLLAHSLLVTALLGWGVSSIEAQTIDTGGGTTTGGTTTGSTSVDFGGGGSGEGGSGLSGPELRSFGSDIDATGGTGFAGRGNTADNFVGGTVQQGNGNTGRGNNSQFSSLGRGQGGVQRGRGNTGPSRSERLRPRHRIAFQYTPVQTRTIQSTLITRMQSLPSRVQGVQVTLNEQGTATLRGTAPNTDAAKLAAALARLEPGIRQVENQLQVPSGR